MPIVPVLCRAKWPAMVLNKTNGSTTQLLALSVTTAMYLDEIVTE